MSGHPPPMAATEAFASFVDHPSGYLATAPRNALFRRPGRVGFVSYRRHGRHRLNLGGVQAPVDAREPLLAAFLDDAQAQGDRVVAVQVRREQVALFRAHGFSANQLGSSYALDLGRFALQGGLREKLRNKIARARRAGVAAYELGRDRPASSGAWRAVEAVSRAWLGAKGAAELDFLVGELGAPGESSRRVFVAEQEGRLQGFITYVPAWGTRPGWLHDLTRRLPTAPPGVMELVNATAAARFAGEGARFLHFGMTPFVVDEIEPDADSAMLARAIRLLGRHSFVYPARTQAGYKLKWAPEVVEREWIAFDRVTLGAVWALLGATRSLPWPFARTPPVPLPAIGSELEVYP
jgi:lysylphosphatidylglycerol synthetase-like protein (DUF2156 family)